MAIVYLSYLVVLLFFVISGIFIIYHIVKYSYSKTAMLFTLLIFCSIMGILVFTNITLFFTIDFNDFISILKL